MPNWVFNTLDNYPEELYDKYKSEDTDIDFNKIIPEPEEITNTPSGSYNKIAKDIANYKKYIEEASEIDKKQSQYDRKNPLRDVVKHKAESTTMQIGELAIENPDNSLNEILEMDNNKWVKQQYDDYVEIFGNSRYNRQKDFLSIYDKYIGVEEKRFQEYKDGSKYSTGCETYNSLEEMGNKLIELKEKYGFDNWYDWRVANWGTKWNACESDYDPETKSLHFDTAWSIPYPIISKIADENPEVQLDGYSEEESGWFEEYSTKDGKLSINCRGEYTWDEDDNRDEIREELDPPEVYTYEQIHNDSVKEWASFLSNSRISNI